MQLTEQELKNLLEDEANQKIIMKFIWPYSWNKMLMEDLKSEGMIALWEASLKYDETRGVKFTTFAYHYIQDRIMGAVAELCGAVTISRGMYRKACAIKRNGDKSDTETVTPLNGQKRRKKTAVKNATAALQAIRFVSFDPSQASDTTEGGSCLTLAETLPDPNEKTPFEKLAELEQHDCLQAALKRLKKRELRILAQYFGLEGFKQKMLKDIAKEEGISIPRCTQIKADAIQQLRQYMKCA